MIQCCSLSKRFENVEAVKDISMQVPDGTFLGLLGPNGAGKTTLMRMMTGLLVPDSGTVEFDGRPMDRNAVAVKQSVGVASQHINLDKELTVEENMEFTGRLYRMRKADITASTDRLLAYLGLESVRTRPAQNLSGGMKRKLMIAKAMIHNPQYLFLDEPTVGIDPNARRDIWEFLRARHKEGKTILLTTHYIEEAQHLCDRVMLIDNGMIFKEDTPQGLIDEIEAFGGTGLSLQRTSGHPGRRLFPLYEQGGGRMEITTILWREWLFLKRRFWRITFSQMVSPLLYFVTFGIGLGRMIDSGGQPYLHYLIPGLLSMTTMRNSYTSVSTRISVMRLHEKSFESYFYSPTKMYLLATGHILAGALRGLYSGIFILILGFVSGAGLSLNGWLLLAVTLNALIFSALGFFAAMIIESHYDMNNFTNIVITPMSFLCGTFFSLDGIPEALKWLVNVMPLTHTTRLIRQLAFGGGVNWASMAVSVLFVIVLWACSVRECYLA